MKNFNFSKRLGFTSLVSLTCASLLLVQGCSEDVKELPPKPVVAMQISTPSALAEAPFPGRAKAGQEVNLSFRVSGPLIELPVNVGTKVKQGDIVARIDPKSYINSVGTAKGQLERAIAASKRAKADHQRIKNVFNEDPGATSQSALDLAKADYDSSRANAESLKSTLETATDRLTYTSLHAPFDGVIVSTYTENYETVIAKQPIVRVLNPSIIEFVIYIPETLISYVSYVENIDVTFDALPNIKVPAKVKEVGHEASQATRTYPVTLVMQQPENGQILPGMAGSALVQARYPDSINKSGVEIPATAVFSKENPEKSYVWVINSETNTLSPREVSIDKLSKHGLKVNLGLNAGEWIVTKGVNSVKDGQKVRILNTSKKGA